MSNASRSSAEFMLQASRVMKALGHPVRLEIGKYLGRGEHSVAEIQNHLGLLQPLTSQHLRLMLRRGIVTFRREGTTCYYSIGGEFIHKVLACLAECEQRGIQSGNGSAESAERNGGARRSAAADQKKRRAARA